MCFLPEFKLFILSNFVVGADLVEDALRDLLASSKGNNPSSASGRLAGAINRLSLIKRKGLWKRLTDTHLDRVVHYCFPLTGREELAADWVKEQVGDHGPELLAVHQEEEGIDLEAAIVQEASVSSLMRRRDFTFKFLLRKQIEQGERDTKARTLYRDEEEKREVEASLHVRVQKEEGNHLGRQLSEQEMVDLKIRTQNKKPCQWTGGGSGTEVPCMAQSSLPSTRRRRG